MKFKLKSFYIQEVRTGLGSIESAQKFMPGFSYTMTCRNVLRIVV